jgi:hypothetical protein
MRNHWTLAGGILAIAFVLGYVTGASGTPVGSVVIPAVFGIVLAALGLFQSPWLSKDASEALKSLTDGHKILIEKIDHQQKLAPLRICVALLCFSCGYMGGAYIGATARVSKWYAPSSLTFDTTWSRHKLPEPPSVDAAVYWVYVQTVLSERGLSDEELKRLYLLQSKDWTARAKVTAQPPAPAASASLAPSDSTLKALEEWSKQPPSSTNPIANQPPQRKQPAITG